MNRITESNPFWMGEEMWASACEPDDETMEEVYCKLWSYENTGLEPEEICFRASQWISVEDRLPEEKESVLVHYIDGWMPIAYLINGKWYQSGGETSWLTVTHWMPLPEPPKEE